jgi:hypothetical protein
VMIPKLARRLRSTCGERVDASQKQSQGTAEENHRTSFNSVCVSNRDDLLPLLNLSDKVIQRHFHEFCPELANAFIAA